MNILETTHVTKRFGGLTAVNTVDLTVAERSIASIIGPNGAGKTTFFNCLTGFYRPEEGSMIFDGVRLNDLRPDQITGLGISRTYQNIRLFHNMSALENILAGQHPYLQAGPVEAIVRALPHSPPSTGERMRETLAFLCALIPLLLSPVLWITGRQFFSDQAISNLALGLTVFVGLILLTGVVLWGGGIVCLIRWVTHSPKLRRILAAVGLGVLLTVPPLSSLLYLVAARLLAQEKGQARTAVEEEKGALRRATDLLNFVGLAGKGDWLARNLPYGDQRRLEIARALAGEPKLLLLDEPTAGMNPAETEEMIRFIRQLRDQLGITILLIEHDMKVVMEISDRVTVLDYGTKICEGSPDHVQCDPQVIEAYLGKKGVA